jgi:hypothetical protein
MRKKKQSDPIPREFSSYEEASDFWDAHDTTDYPDAFRTVKVVAKFRNRHYEIPIPPDIVRALQERSRKRGVSLGRLTTEILRQRLGR